MIPIEVDGDFTTDASGNGKDARVVESGHWCAVYASCQAAGSGQWVAGKLGKAQFFQQGANVVMGPVLLRPGERAQVTVAGASANTQASVVYWGWQSDLIDGSDLAQVVPSIETAGSLSGSIPLSLSGNVPVVNAPGTNLSTITPRLLIDTVVQPPGTGVTKTEALPTGTQVLSLLMIVGAGGTGTPKAGVTGTTSGYLYPANSFISPPPNPIKFLVEASVDTAVTVNFDANSVTGASTTFYLSALPYDPVVIAQFQDFFTNPIYADGSGPTLSGFGLRTSQQYSKPAPWQAPNLSGGMVTGFLNLPIGGT
jgi:hypothetical protein